MKPNFFTHNLSTMNIAKEQLTEEQWGNYSRFIKSLPKLYFHEVSSKLGQYNGAQIIILENVDEEEMLYYWETYNDIYDQNENDIGGINNCPYFNYGITTLTRNTIKSGIKREKKLLKKLLFQFALENEFGLLSHSNKQIDYDIVKYKHSYI